MNRNAYSILPIGAVNLNTAHNSMFVTVFDCWTENQGSNIVVRDGSKVRVIHTSGDFMGVVAQYPIGKLMQLRHDQTCASIGYLWEVLGGFEHNRAGLQQIKNLVKKNSLSFSTFK